jgi:trehalose 6-phosphate phosphatase
MRHYSGDVDNAMNEKKTIDAFQHIDKLKAARIEAGHLLLGLDFDGTLAAIVPRPADAALLEGALPILQRLAARPDTTVAVITGRGIPDVRRRTGLQDIHYAGNHGLELEGPHIRWVHPGAEAERSTLKRVRRELDALQHEWPDVIIEDKSVSLSVHFRTVEDRAAGEKIVARVHELAGRVPGRIRLMGGRRVVEIRPDVEWDKGSALTKLRETLGLMHAPAVFIGDDVTDEDAFRALDTASGDVGIVVGRQRIAHSLADAYVESPADVVQFLALLA